MELNVNQRNKGFAHSTPPLPSKHGFVCYVCGRQRPWTELEFSRDASGRYRRLCRMCEMANWDAATASMKQ